MKKLRVAVIYGGRSGEHEVSIVSARSVMKALDRSTNAVIPILVSKTGVWDRVVSQRMCDVAFPLIHGTFGEDGCLQGMLEMANVPYVGCGVLASALGMDKVAQKQVLAHSGLPITKYIWFRGQEWRAQRSDIVRRIEQALRFPVFCKPARMGSSVGISKAGDRDELLKGIRLALTFDEKIIVERAVPRAREIEVSVLGATASARTSVPGEIVPSNEFYDYNAKYVDGASRTIIPAPLPQEMTDRIRRMAIDAFRAIDGYGMARVDFLLSAKNGSVVVNELNTIPGFTSISMYPKLWEASGMRFPRLLDRLIQLARERRKSHARLATSYDPKSKWWAS